MNALVIKSVKRLYKLFKIYTTLAIIGALTTLLVEIIIAWPLVLIATVTVAAFASSVLLLWAQSRGNNRGELIPERLGDRHPPKLPESLMMVSLPIDIADQIIGDLTHEFYRLRSKYGRSSAITWYTIQSASVFIRATAMHVGLIRHKSFSQFLNKEIS